MVATHEPVTWTPTYPLLSLANVRKRFGALVALDSVSFELSSGAILGLIGPNGAGKSTLLDVISGFTRADSGAIIVNGEDVLRRPAAHRIRLGFGRTFQTPRVMSAATVWENVLIGTYPWNRHPLTGVLCRTRTRRAVVAFVEEILTRLGLAEQQREIAGRLSYGQRKMVEFARTLAARPNILLLDEPLAGLSDDEARTMETTIASIATQGVAVLLVEHHLDAVARLCDNTVVLHHGIQIAFGPVPELFASQEVRRAYASIAT